MATPYEHSCTRSGTRYGTRSTKCSLHMQSPLPSGKKSDILQMEGHANCFTLSNLRAMFLQSSTRYICPTAFMVISTLETAQTFLCMTCHNTDLSDQNHDNPADSSVQEYLNCSMQPSSGSWVPLPVSYPRATALSKGFHLLITLQILLFIISLLNSLTSFFYLYSSFFFFFKSILIPLSGILAKHHNKKIENQNFQHCKGC